MPIAVISNTFPSMPFIYNEVLGLRKRNMSVKTFSIRRPTERIYSEGCLELMDTTTFLLPLDYIKFIWAHIYFVFSRPLSYFGTLFFVLSRHFDNAASEEFKKESIFKSDRVRTFFHFLEGVYFAKLLKDDGTITHIHAHFASHSTTLAMVASSLTGIPFSFTAHAYDIWSDRLFLEEKVNAAKFVVTCTRFGKEQIIKGGQIHDPDKISTIYHGIDTRKFTPSRSAEQRKRSTILTVGRLCARKAQENLITACKVLRDEGYDIDCQIVGDGPLSGYLRSLVVENKLEGVVNFPGQVYQEDLHRYFHEADIFVLPSLSENLPNVILESISSGLPVIATEIAAVPELIIHMETGLLVKPGDVQGLVDAIKLLVQDRELARRLSENGRRHVCQNFDQESSLDRIAKLYESNGVSACDCGNRIPA